MQDRYLSSWPVGLVRDSKVDYSLLHILVIFGDFLPSKQFQYMEMGTRQSGLGEEGKRVFLLGLRLRGWATGCFY